MKVFHEGNITYKKIEDDEIARAKELLCEYFKWLDKDLCFQNVEEELGSFPQKYDEPNGAFIVAKDMEHLVGCVAFWGVDDGICELKRMFVRDEYRGKGIGKVLLELAITDAAMKGYGKIRLDTLDIMERALEMYRKCGLYDIEPYYYNPYEGAVYLEKVLM